MRAPRFMQALLIAGCLVSASAATHAGERVYKWVDDKGTVHYGRQPPLNVKSEAIEVKSGFSTAAEDQPADAAPPPQATTAAEPDDETCNRARRNLAALQSGGELKRKDDYGQEHVMSDEEKSAEKARAEAAIARACKPGAPSTAP